MNVSPETNDAPAYGPHNGSDFEPAPVPAPTAEPIAPAPPQPTSAPAASGKSAQNWYPGRMIGNAFAF